MSYFNKRNSLFICFFLLGCIFLSLGCWQIKRKSYKDNLINYINKQLSYLPEAYSKKSKIMPYRKYSFKGYFLKRFYYIYGNNFFNAVKYFF